MEKHIEDYWNVDGERELSDAWTVFTRFIVLNERPLDGYTWSGEILTRKQTTSRPDNVWPDMWKHMSDAWKRKPKHQWIIKKPKLGTARRLRGIFFIELVDTIVCEYRLSILAQSFCHGMCRHLFCVQGWHSPVCVWHFSERP